MASLIDDSGTTRFEGTVDGVPPQASASVTTDADTFTGQHDFDFGGPAQGLLVVTVTAINADGETFGPTGGGNVGVVAQNPSGSGPGASPDAVTFALDTGTGIHTGLMSEGSQQGYAVGQVSTWAFTTPRALRVPVSVWADFAVYGGANHPTVTVRIDLVYMTQG